MTAPGRATSAARRVRATSLRMVNPPPAQDRAPVPSLAKVRTRPLSQSPRWWRLVRAERRRGSDAPTPNVEEPPAKTVFPRTASDATQLSASRPGETVPPRGIQRRDVGAHPAPILVRGRPRTPCCCSWPGPTRSRSPRDSRASWPCGAVTKAAAVARPPLMVLKAPPMATVLPVATRAWDPSDPAKDPGGGHSRAGPRPL